MLSYCHRYHAGNFADIHKHSALLAILSHFHQKETPFCVLDAYAGEGWYDLSLNEIQKNKEYLEGYELYKKDLPDLRAVADYYQHRYNLDAVYPGSPAIIARYLRKQDKAIFIEQHPKAYSELERKFRDSTSIHIHKMDALQAIQAFLPFKEGRGLIFIDPSYELKTEYLSVAANIQKNYRKFAQGIYLIWYPILAAGMHHALVDSILALDYKIKPTFWHSEWMPNPKITEGLIGSGIIVINPPWQFEQKVYLPY